MKPPTLRGILAIPILLAGACAATEAKPQPSKKASGMVVARAAPTQGAAGQPKRLVVRSQDDGTSLVTESIAIEEAPESGKPGARTYYLRSGEGNGVRIERIEKGDGKFVDPVEILKAWGFKTAPGLKVTQE